MKIGVIGTGYVGLVSGVMLSQMGHNIIGLDADLAKIEKLNKGQCVIYEERLESYLVDSLNKKSIMFTNDYDDLEDVEAVFICVGTPANEDGSANLTYVEDAIKMSAKYLKEDSLIIIKSTVPPGTALQMQSMLENLGYKQKIASNPEFLREGAAVYDFNNPDRIIVGAQNQEDITKLERIYLSKIENNIPVVTTDTTTAELIKYTSNSFLAIKISFINEMANLCEKVDADIEGLALGVGLDKRIGSQFLNSGPGYGGSCFPKDTSALAVLARQKNSPSNILEAAIKSNLDRYSLMRNKIKHIMKEKKNISVLGLAFKANTDDVRESPAVEIMKLLQEDDFNISVYDPVALDNFRKLGLKNINYHLSIDSCCLNADSIVILTEWEEFTKINWQQISSLVKQKIIIDLRRVANKTEAVKAGFEYFTVGKAGANK